MTRTRAFAKINLALVVGAQRPDGKHEVATVLQRVDLQDVVELEPATAAGIVVEGFEEDTLVRRALEALDEVTGLVRGWHVRIEKGIPVRSGLGGGSSDAAAALRLADAMTSDPLPSARLHSLAAGLGADVPFFFTQGTQLGVGDGTELSPLVLPQDYVVVLALPHGVEKESTAAVYRNFDERRGHEGFEERRTELLELLRRVDGPSGIAGLPLNDLASSSSAIGGELKRLGAFRADVSGAGPAVYGLFEREDDARRAVSDLRKMASTWLARPVAGP
jgi:4-diphosphocytidyl-2-C-methyl-D-erythritol kinase